MSTFQLDDRGGELGAEATSDKAERIIRDAESRRQSAAETPLRAATYAGASVQLDDPAPLSSALHIATLLPAQAGHDDPTPLSSALGIPTLLKEAPRARDPQPHPDNPAPFSTLLGLPVLLNEHKTPKRA